MAIKALGFGRKQISPQSRPYFIWVWSPTLEAWEKTVQSEPPFPSSNTYRRERRPSTNNSRRGLGANSSSSGTRRRRQRSNANRGRRGGGNSPPDTQILIPTGVSAGGGIGTPPGSSDIPVTAYFPPVSYDIECNSNPNLIVGGQDDGVVYDITISARGLIRDVQTEGIITSFNITKTVEVQGPVVGWSITQITRDPMAKDLELIIYYGLSASEPNIFEQRYPYDLSLASLPDGFSNMTLEGFDYFFDIEILELLDLRRADGMLNGCEVNVPFDGGQCETNYDIDVALGYNNGSGFIQTGTAKVLSVPGPIKAVNVIDGETYEKFVNSSPLIAQGAPNQKQWIIRVIGPNIPNTVEFYPHNGPISEMLLFTGVTTSDAGPDGCGNPPGIAIDGVPWAGGQEFGSVAYHIFGTYYSKNAGAVAQCDTVGYWRTIDTFTSRVFGSSQIVNTGSQMVFSQGPANRPIAFITQAQFDARYTGPITGTAEFRDRNDSCLSTGDDTVIYGDVWEIVHAYDPDRLQTTYPFSGLCDYIEPPDVCIVTIRDLSGVIYEQSYVGQPNVQISSDLTPRPF